MPHGGSVTQLIGRLKAGDEAALAELHRRCWPLLLSLARDRLAGAPCRAADEEDVAQESFWAFCRNLQEDRIPRLENRQDLFALLIAITWRRAARQVRDESRDKRGSGKVRGESAFDDLAGGDSDARGLEMVEDSGDPPDAEIVLRDLYANTT